MTGRHGYLAALDDVAERRAEYEATVARAIAGDKNSAAVVESTARALSDAALAAHAAAVHEGRANGELADALRDMLAAVEGERQRVEVLFKEVER